MDFRQRRREREKAEQGKAMLWNGRHLVDELTRGKMFMTDV
jgi:hypothetical protein